MYALFDTQTKEYLSADGGYVWGSEYTCKSKYNNFARWGISDSKAFSKQDRVIIREVNIASIG